MSASNEGKAIIQILNLLLSIGRPAMYEGVILDTAHVCLQHIGSITPVSAGKQRQQCFTYFHHTWIKYTATDFVQWFSPNTAVILQPTKRVSKVHVPPWPRLGTTRWFPFLVSILSFMWMFLLFFFVLIFYIRPTFPRVLLRGSNLFLLPVCD